MDEDKRTRCMDQRIFGMGLSVESTSMYLLCCALVDEGARLSRKNIQAAWNASAQALDRALEELEGLNIVRKVLSDQQGHEMYRVLGPELWGKGP